MKFTAGILTGTLCFVSIMGLSNQALALSGPIDLNCKGEVTNLPFLKLSYADQTLQSLIVQSYEIVKDGAQQKDSEIGRSVFGVSVSDFVQYENGSAEINVSLHDYSDSRSWRIIISKDTKEVAVVSTFESSDGDGQLHVTSENLNCR